VASTALGGVAITLFTFHEEEAPPLDTTLELVAPNGSHVTLASLLDHEVGQQPRTVAILPGVPQRITNGSGHDHDRPTRLGRGDDHRPWRSVRG